MFWQQTDPIGLNAGNNDYQFVGNSPTEATDSSGLAPNAFDKWMTELTGAPTPGAYVAPIIQNPQAITVNNLVSGANYGSAVMLKEMSFGYMPGAQNYIDTHKGEYPEKMTTVVQGAGVVARESLLLAGTMGTGSVIQSGRYSVWTVRTARGVQVVFTVRGGYQTYQSGKATWEAFLKGDTWGVAINGVCTLLSALSTYSGGRSLLRSPGKVAPKGLSAAESWGKPSTLADHFERHGGDFGAKTAEGYAQKASQFLQDAQRRGLPTKIGPDGTIRVYDPATNTFGSYNPNGTTKTFYKPDPANHPYPTNLDYWNAQPGSAPWTPKK